MCVCCTNTRGFDLTDEDLLNLQETAKQAEVKESMRKQHMALILGIGDNPRNDFIRPKKHETGNGLGLMDLISYAHRDLHPNLSRCFGTFISHTPQLGLGVLLLFL